ncbi:MAG: glycosyltransferase family 2 protein [Oscillospiraceae bacterium]|nr:glycosyltransferase family 2 protein [Oscillospiraceae bacterium]
MDVSIIMINYNTPKLTEQAISSIFSCRPNLKFEIILVDNSEDPAWRYSGSRQGIKVLSGVKNRGFGNACNVGVLHACGKYLLFLNSDTLMHPGTLEQCTAYLSSHPKVGALGARTLLKNGTLDHACKRGFPTPCAAFYYFTKLDRLNPANRKLGAYRATWLGETSVGQVDSVAGSFLMMPKDVFERTNGFDETFFMYGEDLDLCFRVKQLGYQVVYYGKASITHLKGQSGLHTQSKTVAFHFYHAMELFYQKHYLQKYPSIVNALILSAIRLKYGISIAKIRRGSALRAAFAHNCKNSKKAGKKRKI